MLWKVKMTYKTIRKYWNTSAIVAFTTCRISEEKRNQISCSSCACLHQRVVCTAEPYRCYRHQIPGVSNTYTARMFIQLPASKDGASASSEGRLFQVSTIRRLYRCCLTSSLVPPLVNFSLCPLVLVPSSFK